MKDGCPQFSAGTNALLPWLWFQGGAVRPRKGWGRNPNEGEHHDREQQDRSLEETSRMSVKFKIEARLTVDPAPDVAFDTILDVGTGKYEVQASG